MAYLHISTQFELEGLENTIFEMLQNHNLYFIRENHNCEHPERFNFLWEGNHPSIKIVKFRLNLINDINAMCIVFHQNFGVNRMANTTCPVCAECTYVLP